jgi:hypothetical protein
MPEVLKGLYQEFKLQKLVFFVFQKIRLLCGVVILVGLSGDMARSAKYVWAFVLKVDRCEREI